MCLLSGLYICFFSSEYLQIGIDKTVFRDYNCNRRTKKHCVDGKKYAVAHFREPPVGARRYARQMENHP